MKVAYRRVSTTDQKFDRQDVGQVDKVFEEKISGKTIKDRPELQTMVDFVREGDEVVVYEISRLARDMRDLLTIVQTLVDKKVSIHFIKEKLTFSGEDDPFSKLQLQLLSAFSEFERSITVSRVREGVRREVELDKDRKPQDRKFKGRKKQINDDKICDLVLNQNYAQTEVAEMLGISRQSVFRALKKRKETQEQVSA